MIDDLKKWQVKQSEAYKIYIKTSAVGLEFGLAIAIGALGGYFVDNYFKTSPIGLIVGVVIGSAAAIKRLVVFTKDYLKNQNDKDRDSHK